jgi:hypothetical protein
LKESSFGRPHPSVVAAFMFLGLVTALRAHDVCAQSPQAGVAAVTGLGGFGIEVDVALRRIGLWGRAQTSLETGARFAGARFYFYGERNSGFYVAAGRGQVHCSKILLGGVATDCDGEWHTTSVILGGTEIGSPHSRWSVYVDAGPYLDTRDVPGLRHWTFAFGVRLRP